MPSIHDQLPRHREQSLVVLSPQAQSATPSSRSSPIHRLMLMGSQSSLKKKTFDTSWHVAFYCMLDWFRPFFAVKSIIAALIKPKLWTYISRSKRNGLHQNVGCGVTRLSALPSCVIFFSLDAYPSGQSDTNNSTIKLCCSSDKSNGSVAFIASHVALASSKFKRQLMPMKWYPPTAFSEMYYNKK